MTPEERAEARAAIQKLETEHCVTYEWGDALTIAIEALEAAERERDEAQQIAAKQIDEWVKGASQKLIDQRDTARAQVAKLTEALRTVRANQYTNAHGCIVIDAALKAAGVEP